MQLRKSVSTPFRFEEDFTRQENPRSSTKPAYPKLMTASTVQFNPNHPPSAFPSRPFRHEESMSQQTIHIEALGATEMMAIVDMSKNMTKDPALRDVESESPSLADLEEVESMTPNPPISMSPNQDHQAVLLKVDEAEDIRPHNLWPSLPNVLHYHIYKRLEEFYPDRKPNDLLGLTDEQLRDLEILVHRRDRCPLSRAAIWNKCASNPKVTNGIPRRGNQGERSTNLGDVILSALGRKRSFCSVLGNESPTDANGMTCTLKDLTLDGKVAPFRYPIEPNIFDRNLDQLLFASNYELAYENELERAVKFLNSRNLPSAILGTWVPDGDESEFFTFYAEEAFRQDIFNFEPFDTLHGTESESIPVWRRGWPKVQQVQFFNDEASFLGDCNPEETEQVPMYSEITKESPRSKIGRPRPRRLDSTPKDIKCSVSVHSKSNTTEREKSHSPKPVNKRITSALNDQRFAGTITLRARSILRETEVLRDLRQDEEDDGVSHGDHISHGSEVVSFLTLTFRNIDAFKEAAARSSKRKTLPSAPMDPSPRNLMEAELKSTGENDTMSPVSLKYSPEKPALRKCEQSPVTGSASERLAVTTEIASDTYQGSARKRKASTTEQQLPPAKRLHHEPYQKSDRRSIKTSPAQDTDLSLHTTANPLPATTTGPHLILQSIETAAIQNFHEPKSKSELGLSRQTHRPQALYYAPELFLPTRAPSCSPIPENEGNKEIGSFLSLYMSPVRFKSKSGGNHTLAGQQERPKEEEQVNPRRLKVKKKKDAPLK